MLRLLLILGALVGLLAAAMAWSSSSAGGRADFTFINRGDVKNLDLVRMTYLQDIRIAYGLWEGLYTLDGLTLNAVPGCADPIDVSADKKVYTFHIRPEARWSDGKPLRARDFVFAWKRMLDEGGDYSDLHYYIKGAEQYAKDLAAKKNPDYGSVGVEVLDDKTLRVTLANPTTFFPDLCAFPPFFPLDEQTVMETDPATGARRVNPKFTRPPNLVTNGPYRLERWEFKRRLRMVASDSYWDRARVKCKTVEMLIMDDPQTQFTAYDSGAVDWLADMTGNFGAELRDAALRAPTPSDGARRRALHDQVKRDLHVFTGFGTYFYSFNCQATLPDGRPNPFTRVGVRRAFTMAIEKQFLVDNITRLGEPVAVNYIPPGVFEGYVSPRGLPTNVPEARRLLAEAGYPAGQGFPHVKLNFNVESQHKDIAEYVQRQWKQNLGVDVELDGKELKSYGDQLKNKQYAVSRASWSGDYNDPSTFTDKYRSGAGNNDAAWKNLEYDRLCEQASVETDPAKRLVLFNRAETLLCEEAPILPLFHYVNAYVFRPNVKGIALNPRNMVMFKGIQKGE